MARQRTKAADDTLPPDPVTDFNPAALDTPESRASEPLPNDEDAAKTQYTKRADPWGSHSVSWPDGYKITLQESDSRNTIELQFGDGSREAQPNAFAEIKQRLKEEGFRWNGTNAWAKELTPVVGTQNNRLRAKEENRRVRAHVEDLVFPAVIAMEEAVRGEIPLTETSRSRITRAAGQGR